MTLEEATLTKKKPSPPELSATGIGSANQTEAEAAIRELHCSGLHGAADCCLHKTTAGRNFFPTGCCFAYLMVAIPAIINEFL